MVKKALWNILGFTSLGCAYIGVVTPGIPYSPFVVFAAYCFSKGSDRMHRWLYNHKLFGPFLTNWTEKRVFPLKLKFFMLVTMGVSLVLMYTGGVAIKGIIYTAIFMACVAVWAWKFPSSVKEYNQRVADNKKIGWFNNSF